jgi:esterase
MELNHKTFGTGEPVIILHGLFGTLDNWQTVAKKLAEHFMVYIVDQRNHGRSPHLEGHNYKLMAEDLADFMEENWIHNAHIIGHSMGGKTAMQFAVDYPDMLNKLVVVDIAPKAYEGGHQTIFEALLSVDIENVQTRKEVEEHLSKYIEDPGVRLFLMKNLSRKKEGGFQWKMNLQEIYINYSNILDTIEIEDVVKNQSLFINGGKSNYVNTSDQEAIKEQFATASFETIEGAGHWVHAEQPQALIKSVLNFLTH